MTDAQISYLDSDEFRDGEKELLNSVLVLTPTSYLNFRGTLWMYIASHAPVEFDITEFFKYFTYDEFKWCWYYIRSEDEKVNSYIRYSY